MSPKSVQQLPTTIIPKIKPYNMTSNCRSQMNLDNARVEGDMDCHFNYVN